MSARRELYARVEILVAIHKGTPMQLTRLVYASYHGGTTVKALGDILDQSQANNEVDGITGILVASDEDFMQFLEGGRTVVAECMMRIMKDERHQNIRILLAREAETRLFSGWSMRGIDASRLKPFFAALRPMSAPAHKAEAPLIAQTLVNSYERNFLGPVRLPSTCPCQVDKPVPVRHWNGYQAKPANAATMNPRYALR